MIELALMAIAAAGLSLAMAAAWRLQAITGRSGWIDTIWSAATGAAGLALSVAALLLPGTFAPRALLVAVMVVAWSLRLASHIGARTHGAPDDPRYAKLAEDWGAAFRPRLFWFLQTQAAAALPLAGAVFAAATQPTAALRIADLIGALLMFAALVGEAIADRQLVRFRADPANRGRVCDTGLWAWSRHPNYFFEWMVWLAYPVIAITPGGGHVWGWGALAAPLLMYWLLAHVSGVPLLEAHMLRSRGDAFRRYQERVPAFWPRPPRSPPH